MHAVRRFRRPAESPGRAIRNALFGVGLDIGCRFVIADDARASDKQRGGQNQGDRPANRFVHTSSGQEAEFSGRAEVGLVTRESTPQVGFGDGASLRKVSAGVNRAKARQGTSHFERGSGPPREAGTAGRAEPQDCPLHRPRLLPRGNRQRCQAGSQPGHTVH